MKLTTLLKQYDLNSDFQYFEMILQSLENGNRNQAISQFKSLPKQNQKDFIVYIATAFEKIPVSQNQFTLFVNEL
jgi:hypothetical protein